MKYITYILAIIILPALGSCVTLFNNEHNLFHVNDIYYQSWMLDDTKKGTDLYMELVEVDADVEFTYLVFRGVEVDVSASLKGGKTIVKATYNFGPSYIENYEYRVTGESDMLKYTYRGKEFSYPLKNVKRKNTAFIE